MNSNGYSFNSLKNTTDFSGNNITCYNNADFRGTLTRFPIDDTSIKIIGGVLTANTGYTSDISTESLYVNHIYNLSNSDNSIHYHDTLSGNYIISSDIQVEQIHSVGDLHIISNNGSGTTFIENDLYGYTDILNDGITWSNGYRSKVGSTNLYNVGVYSGSSINIYTDGGIKLLSSSDKYINANGVLIDYYENISNVNTLSSSSISTKNLRLDYIQPLSGLEVNIATEPMNTLITNDLWAQNALFADVYCSDLNTPLIRTNAIYATDIVSNSLTTNTISSNSLSSTSISTNSLTANNIYANHLFCSDFSTNTFTSSSISCNQLYSSVGTIGTLTSTSITCDRINTNYINTTNNNSFQSDCYLAWVYGSDSNLNYSSSKFVIEPSYSLLGINCSPLYNIDICADVGRYSTIRQYTRGSGADNQASLFLDRADVPFGNSLIKHLTNGSEKFQTGLKPGTDNYNIYNAGLSRTSLYVDSANNSVNITDGLMSSSLSTNSIITDSITGKTASANLGIKTTDANGKIYLLSETQLINSSTTPRLTISSQNNSGTSSAYLSLKRGNTTSGFAGVQLYNTDTAIWAAGLSSGDNNYHISSTGDALLLNTNLDATFGGNAIIKNGNKLTTNKIESTGTSDIFITNLGGNGVIMAPTKTLFVDYLKQAGSSDMIFSNTTSVSNSALTLSSTTGGLALTAATNKNITLTSLGTGVINLTGNASTSGTHNFNGVITAVSGISYTNATLGYSPTTLTYYEETSSTISGAGAWTGSLTFYFVRVGNMICITWPTSATFTAAATTTVSFTSIPARFRPSAEKRFIYQATVNGNGNAAVLTLSSGGVLTFYASPSGANWTSGLPNNIIQGHGISFYFNV